MSHAHEIGLSLALRDGVAKSALLAQSDILAIDRATRANVVSLQDLQSTSNLISRLSGVVTVREPILPTEISEKVNFSSEAKHDKPELPPITIAGPAALLLAEFGDRAKRESLSLTTQAVSWAELTNLPPKSLLPESAPAIQQLRKPEGAGDDGAPVASPLEVHAPWKATSAQAAPVRQTAERITVLKMASEREGGTFLSSRSRAAAAPPAIAMLSVPYTGPALPAPGDAPAAPGPVSLGKPLNTNLIQEVLGATESGTPNAPAAPLARVSAQLQREGRLFKQRDAVDDALAKTSDLPSAPPANMREQQHMEGDVYLDGTLVGRWISRFLSREASRSPAGPTGFDKRRSPLMPGASVGM